MAQKLRREYSSSTGNSLTGRTFVRRFTVAAALMSFLQTLGSQNAVLQRLVIHTLQPIFVALLLLFLSVFVLYPVSALAFVPLVVFGLYRAYQYYTKKPKEQEQFPNVHPLQDDNLAVSSSLREEDGNGLHTPLPVEEEESPVQNGFGADDVIRWESSSEDESDIYFPAQIGKFNFERCISSESDSSDQQTPLPSYINPIAGAKVEPCSQRDRSGSCDDWGIEYDFDRHSIQSLADIEEISSDNDSRRQTAPFPQPQRRRPSHLRPRPRISSISSDDMDIEYSVRIV